MIKVVLIGYGRIAQNHIAALRQIEGVEISAICDHSEAKMERAAGELGCRTYVDCQKMIDEIRPDAAVICVPTFAHEDYIRICAENKVAVLCEKPLTRTSGACGRVVELVKKSGIILMTAQVVRFWQGYAEIKQMIDRKEFGDIYMMRFRRVTSRDDAIAKWLNMPRQGGGAIHDMLVHDVDFLRYIAGPFESGYANATKDETGCYNNVMANIVCKNGVHAMAEASFTMQTGYPFSFSVSIIGSEATLEYDYHAGIRIGDTDEAESNMKIWRKGTGLEVLHPEERDAFLCQMRYFLDCVKNKKQPEIITLDQTYEVVLMVDALHESAHSGTVVRLDEYKPFDYHHPVI